MNDRVEWGYWKASVRARRGATRAWGRTGDTIRPPIVRLSTADGSSGFGRGRMDLEQANRLLGQPLESLFSEHAGVLDPEWQPLETALWDLAGQRSGLLVHVLAAKITGRIIPENLSVPCYDTSLYFDDLHLASSEEAAQWMAEEARAGVSRSHRDFKFKVGHGARPPNRHAADRRHRPGYRHHPRGAGGGRFSFRRCRGSGCDWSKRNSDRQLKHGVATSAGEKKWE